MVKAIAICEFFSTFTAVKTNNLQTYKILQL